MNYKKILLGLFLLEIFVGSALFAVGIFSNPPNWFLSALGASVFLAHATEYFLLSRVK